MSLSITDTIQIDTYKVADNPVIYSVYSSARKDLLLKRNLYEAYSPYDEAHYATNSNLYVILIKQGNIVLAGAAFLIKSKNTELKIERVIGKEFPSIFNIVKDLQYSNVAEIIGLWNSYLGTKKGITADILIQCCLSLAKHLKIRYVISLNILALKELVDKYEVVYVDDIGRNGILEITRLKVKAFVCYFDSIESYKCLNYSLRAKIDRFSFEKNYSNFVEETQQGNIEFQVRLHNRM